MDEYSSFIHKSRYARYNDDLERRESWEETVQRYVDFFGNRCDLSTDVKAELFEGIQRLDVMPSMRCLMTAGPALERDEVAGYNCAYVAVDHPKVFDEILYVLMCGTGVGFSVERQFITKLPAVAEEIHESPSTIRVADSKIGWARAFRELVTSLYAGDSPKWDLSGVRGAGERLRTFGGRASGPAPLEDLFQFTKELFFSAVGRKLSSIECHDLVCKVASIVVVGGVRRSALISLSNLTDQRIRHAKDGQFWETNPHRSLSNNSVAYTETPDPEIFMEEWLAMHRSRSGERGVFNRVAAEKQVLKSGRREGGHEWGTNPCSEIILRPAQFCNLTEVVVRAGDTLADLRAKVRLATILGTMQSTLTNFRYLRKIWKTNCEEERLLGVSLTGIQDHKLLGDPTSKSLPKWLRELRDVAIETNKEWAKVLGIPTSSAITCVKPSGTVSQLVNSSSGIHARYAPYYIRRVRSDAKDPLGQWMEEQGFPCEADVFNPEVKVFAFPIKAPAGARVEGDLTALESLELWAIYQEHWCEHKPSITVHYQDREVLDIGAWVYRNFDKVSGVSFLPKEDHVYQQAPYEGVSEDRYRELLRQMPRDVVWDQFVERYDNTSGSQELACSGGVCEVVDLT